MEQVGKERILVTGGSGFVGSHIILKLLQAGYTVRTTTRNSEKANSVRALLRNAGITSLEKLSFVEADLNHDRNWEEAVDQCTYVMHVASPLPEREPDDENEVILPALNGTLRILEASRKAGVKRVVMTSSFAAIGYTIDPNNHVFSEADWTDPAKPNPAYIRSKAVAEKAAWNYIDTTGGKLELSVINPTGIFGPSLNDDYSLSLELIRQVLNGDPMDAFDYAFGVVDVRDVADLHILAMTHPKASGHRFLATGDGVMTCYEIGELIKQERSSRSARIGKIKPVPSSNRILLSNEKAKTMLGWKPRDAREAILASVDSLPG